MVRYYLISLTLIFTFTGCISSPYREVKPNEVLENKDVRYIAPMGWQIHKKYYVDDYKDKRTIPGLDKDIHGSNLTFHIFTDPFRLGPLIKVFDKDTVYPDSDKKVRKRTKKEIKSDKQYGVSYQKVWVTYVSNLKCTGSVAIRGGTIGTKWYYISCGYYDTTETEDDGKRFLQIQYRFNYMSDYYNSLLQDKGVPKEEWFTKEEAEKMLKSAVKEAVKTIKIKNFDKNKMEREGLMHYNKEFTSTKW